MDADRIYRDYARMIYIYILQMCHDADLAEDIVQTTFLKAIQHADSFIEKLENCMESRKAGPG